MKKLVISGATGMIGRVLCKKLAENYSLTIVSRNINNYKVTADIQGEFVSWDDENQMLRAISEAYGIINLAGQNINSKKWSNQFKQDILESRVNAGQKLAEIIAKSPVKPSVFIQASAIGYYTHDYEMEYNENSICNNPSFLHQVGVAWEKSSKNVERFGVRHIITRFGIVLDKNKGAFPSIVKPFEKYYGGYMGNGRQWLSWIHINDLVNAIVFLLENENTGGIYNLVSPNPIRYNQMSKILSETLHRPAWLNIPGLILKLIWGQKVKETLLTSQRVVPMRLLEKGFQFRFSEFKKAVENLIIKK